MTQTTTPSTPARRVEWIRTYFDITERCVSTASATINGRQVVLEPIGPYGLWQATADGEVLPVASVSLGEMMGLVERNLRADWREPMTSRDASNRRRWAIDQRRRARAAYVAPDQSQRLNELRALAALMEPLPHMATTLATVQAEITRLVQAEDPGVTTQPGERR